ncbi:hypothetical protein L916_12557 [Phytophthora nicotianae]|uniref:Uncharacterized protein n=1 Tax=Phytophthora nicotianae TaxID=4792 RepID=W2IMH9_PHYNI|nr:hypothetical protein L916_12557 [Phytophthora nicotianae]
MLEMLVKHDVRSIREEARDDVNFTVLHFLYAALDDHVDVMQGLLRSGENLQLCLPVDQL